MTEDHEKNPKRQRRSTNSFLLAWAWKREHRPDKVRFQKPYLHTITLDGNTEVQLPIKQAHFKHEGFASTVWDSSIVMAKFFERCPSNFKGKRCLDLSAGCGLVGVVLARIGAVVVATDLGPNLGLLRQNAEANVPEGSIQVQAHRWGSQIQDLHPPFDVIVACDVMYIEDAVPDLVASLAGAAGPNTRVYVAHGRNRQAEPTFLRLAERHFRIEDVPSEELDEVYQTGDVRVLRMVLRT